MEIVNDYFESDIESYILDLDRTDITKNSYKKILRSFSLYLRERGLAVPKTRNIIEYKNYLDKQEKIRKAQEAMKAKGENK